MELQRSVRKRKTPLEKNLLDLNLKLSLPFPSSDLPSQRQEVVLHELPPPSLPRQLSLLQQHHVPPSATSPTQVISKHAPQRPVRRRSVQPSNSKNDVISPPYPWATNRRAMIHNLDYLRTNKLNKISGEVQCKKCNARFSHEFDLEEKFKEVADYILTNKEIMRERAPKCWLSPDLPECNHCGQLNCLKPVMPDSKEKINWLFLLLGQMLGFCTLEQLKYFCQHTKNHRTGAKDRVLFLTFLGLCKQLDPNGPFDR